MKASKFYKIKKHLLETKPQSNNLHGLSKPILLCFSKSLHLKYSLLGLQKILKLNKYFLKAQRPESEIADY